MEPPVIATPAIALCSESVVMIELGRRSRSSTSSTSRPQSCATAPFLPSSAGTIELPIGEMPSISNAIAMVFAVNCPAQAPAPGDATDSSSARSSSDMSPAAWAPTASNTSWIVTSSPLNFPAATEPP